MSLTNLSKEWPLTNLSKRRSLTNLSKRRSLTNLSKRRSLTNLCKQRSQLGKCGSIHVLEPPSYQSLFLHLCSTRQSLPSDVACINKPKELRHSPHSTLRRIQPYIRRTNCVKSYAHVHPYSYAQLGVITIIHLHRIVFACIDLSSAYRIPSKTLAAYSYSSNHLLCLSHAHSTTIASSPNRESFSRNGLIYFNLAKSRQVWSNIV